MPQRLSLRLSVGSMEAIGPDEVDLEELKRAKTWRDIRAELTRGVKPAWRQRHTAGNGQWGRVAVASRLGRRFCTGSQQPPRWALRRCGSVCSGLHVPARACVYALSGGEHGRGDADGGATPQRLGGVATSGCGPQSPLEEFDDFVRARSPAAIYTRIAHNRRSQVTGLESLLAASSAARSDSRPVT